MLVAQCDDPNSDIVQPQTGPSQHRDQPLVVVSDSAPSPRPSVPSFRPVERVPQPPLVAGATPPTARQEAYGTPSQAQGGLMAEFPAPRPETGQVKRPVTNRLRLWGTSPLLRPVVLR